MAARMMPLHCGCERIEGYAAGAAGQAGGAGDARAGQTQGDIGIMGDMLCLRCRQGRGTGNRDQPGGDGGKIGNDKTAFIAETDQNPAARGQGKVFEKTGKAQHGCLKIAIAPDLGPLLPMIDDQRRFFRIGGGGRQNVTGQIERWIIGAIWPHHPRHRPQV